MSARRPRVRGALRAGLLLLAILALATACEPRPADHAITALELEDRLVAPCCWRDPLRDHHSEIADQLRAELRARLEAGETAKAIEADLVQRYGERIRALPPDSDPRWLIVAASAALAAAGVFALWRMLRRPSLQAATARPPSSGTAMPHTDGAAGQPADSADYETRLDDELAAVS
jgi:cytochrome c-type biogenesis protein CcmH